MKEDTTKVEQIEESLEANLQNKSLIYNYTKDYNDIIMQCVINIQKNYNTIIIKDTTYDKFIENYNIFKSKIDEDLKLSQDKINELYKAYVNNCTQLNIQPSNICKDHVTFEVTPNAMSSISKLGSLCVDTSGSLNIEIKEDFEKMKDTEEDITNESSSNIDITEKLKIANAYIDMSIWFIKKFI